MRLTGLLCASCLALAGCASDGAVRCPQLAAYTLLEESVAADEIPHDGPESQKMIEDYRALRAACRAATPQ